MIRKEREDNHWECCAPPGHVLPETCYKKGINHRDTYRYRILYRRDGDEKRYNKITLRACYDKCKERCQGVK